jgi:molybdopterin-guanine dinucleotide biosynthesis protein
MRAATMRFGRAMQAKLEHLNSLIEANQTDFKIVETYQFDEIPAHYRERPQIVPVRQYRPKRKAITEEENSKSFASRISQLSSM